jgi:hypothetical protein
MMAPNLTFSGIDWPYIVPDATTGGAYATRMSALTVNQGVVLSVVDGKLWGVWIKDNSSRPQAYEPVTYLYWYLYYASNTMTGTIKIYGIKVTT